MDTEEPVGADVEADDAVVTTPAQHLAELRATTVRGYRRSRRAWLVSRSAPVMVVAGGALVSLVASPDVHVATLSFGILPALPLIASADWSRRPAARPAGVWSGSTPSVRSAGPGVAETSMPGSRC